jgi:ABC-type sugar transport system ATPase subunit
MSWLLEMKNITKTFGTVKAVDNISLRLNAGEVSHFAAKMVLVNPRS